MAGRMRLALHIGHGKTGSSALQSWLARHSAALLEQGLAYPLRSPVTGRTEQEALQGRFSMGNGFVFEELLEAGRLAERAWIPPQAHTLMFSCERWTRQWRSSWPAIQAAAMAAGYSLDVLLLVRDPLDHAHSLYRQMVRAHGYAGDLDSWMEIYELPEVVLEVLESFEELKLSCRVANYNRCEHQLLEPLQQWLGLPEGWLQSHPLPQQRVNETPPPALLARQLASNQESAARAAVHRFRTQASPQAQAALLQRLKPVLEAINQRLPHEARLQYPMPESL